MSDDEKKKASLEQSRRNIRDMLWAAIEADPEGTKEIMALCCFVEPENVNDHLMTEYFDAIIGMLTNGVVRDFFMYCLS